MEGVEQPQRVGVVAVVEQPQPAGAEEEQLQRVVVAAVETVRQVLATRWTLRLRHLPLRHHQQQHRLVHQHLP